jgi:hypothetical protein
VLSGNTRVAKFREEDQKILENRLNTEVLYNVYLITQVDTPDVPEGEVSEMGGSLGAITGINQFASEINGFDVYREIKDDEIVRVSDLETERRTSALGLIGIWTKYHDASIPGTMVMSPDEIAGLWHLPHVVFHKVMPPGAFHKVMPLGT